jgi:hypothetical protein
MMMFDHSLAAQEILQEALRVANRQYSDAEIALNGGLDRAKATVQRFRTADLKAHLAKTDNLMLGYRVAERLWNYLDKLGFIKRALQDRQASGLRPDRLAANVMNAFYNVEESETLSWHDDMGLDGEYFCYKPSFRSPGNILKTRMIIHLADGEYFKISEKQASRTDSVRASEEQSTGFGFSKSERLWFFLKEQSRDQPRIFCFNQMDTSFGKVTRLKGHILESDKRYGNEVYKFRVGLIAKETDEVLWKLAHRDEHYDEEAQIDNVPFEDAVARQNAGSRVIFDLQLLKYIEPEIIPKPALVEAVSPGRSPVPRPPEASPAIEGQHAAPD